MSSLGLNVCIYCLPDRFESHINTCSDPFDVDRNANNPKQDATNTPQYGVPKRFV